MKHFSQSGYTLVELVIIVGMIGFVSGIIALTYDLAAKQSIVNRGWSMAVRQVDAAGRWISADVQSAASVTSWSPAAWQCSMIRYEWNGSAMDNVTVSYVIEAGTLYRRINGVEPGSVVAEFIVTDNNSTNFTKLTSGSITNYILNVKAVYDKVPYNKRYVIYPRSGQ